MSTRPTAEETARECVAWWKSDTGGDIAELPRFIERRIREATAAAYERAAEECERVAATATSGPTHPSAEYIGGFRDAGAIDAGRLRLFAAEARAGKEADRMSDRELCPRCFRERATEAEIRDERTRPWGIYAARALCWGSGTPSCGAFAPSCEAAGRALIAAWRRTAYSTPANLTLRDFVLRHEKESK